MFRTGPRGGCRTSRAAPARKSPIRATARTVPFSRGVWSAGPKGPSRTGLRHCRMPRGNVTVRAGRRARDDSSTSPGSGRNAPTQREGRADDEAHNRDSAGCGRCRGPVRRQDPTFAASTGCITCDAACAHNGAHAGDVGSILGALIYACRSVGTIPRVRQDRFARLAASGAGACQDEQRTPRHRPRWHLSMVGTQLLDQPPVPVVHSSASFSWPTDNSLLTRSFPTGLPLALDGRMQESPVRPAVACESSAGGSAGADSPVCEPGGLSRRGGRPRWRASGPTADCSAGR